MIAIIDFLFVVIQPLGLILSLPGKPPIVYLLVEYHSNPDYAAMMSDITLPPRSNWPTVSELPENRLDHIFQALANRTRRSLINMLRDGPAKVTDLAKPFGMSLNAVSKHLIVLERAGLITRNIEGRSHYCALQAEPLATAEQWLASYEIFWTTNLDNLARHVEALEPNKD